MKKAKRGVTIPIPSGKGLTYVLVGALVVGAFLIGNLWNQVQQLKKGGADSPQAGAPTQVKPSRPATGKASIDDDPVIGDSKAPITMIEFSDYECPFCKRYYDQTLPQIKEKYINTGKVKLVYRDLPLAFHEPMATKEAVAANCAREQGGDVSYFKYHDEIFNRTTSNGSGLNDDDLQTIAGDLSLNLSEFNICIKDDLQKQEVKKDSADANAAGATGTPTFVIGKSTADGNIDGRLLIGAQPFAAFEDMFKKFE